MNSLQNFDQETFLSQYWQRQPLLIDEALPGFQSPLGPDELAGLALEPDIESRIIENHGGQWAQQHGPFEEHNFKRDRLWTLLVQAVDHYVPAVAELRKLIDFLPQWRVDDVMASYAPEGGSVGPHYDNYDVFLVQGMGHREWRLGQYCTNNEELLDHPDMKILKQFRQRDCFMTKPGDILYLPARLAHWGVALDECITYSIGFRAPRLNDMLGRWLDTTLEHMNPELFYRDPTDKSELRAGEISPRAIQEAYHLLHQVLAGHMENPNWFGELVTEPRYPVEAVESLESLDEFRTVQLETSSRLAWRQDTLELTAYANGHALPCGRDCLPMLEKLCQRWVLEGQDLEAARQNQDCRQLLQELLNLGCIYGGD